MIVESLEYIMRVKAVSKVDLIIIHLLKNTIKLFM